MKIEYEETDGSIHTSYTSSLTIQEDRKTETIKITFTPSPTRGILNVEVRNFKIVH